MAVTDGKIENFHQRLSRMSKKGLEVFLQRDQLLGLKSLDLELDLELREHCLYGRKIQSSFVRTSHEKKSSPLELVHSYIFGPTEVTSIRSTNYFVTFLNDCT